MKTRLLIAGIIGLTFSGLFLGISLYNAHPSQHEIDLNVLSVQKSTAAKDISLSATDAQKLMDTANTAETEANQLKQNREALFTLTHSATLYLGNLSFLLLIAGAIWPRTRAPLLN